VSNYPSTPGGGSKERVLEQQKMCSKTSPLFALQLHGVDSSMEFWSWDVWLDFLMELLEFRSGAMLNRT